MSDFHIWTTNGLKGRHACTYYRVEVPLSQCEKRYGIGLYVDEGKPEQQEESVFALMYSDIGMTYGASGIDALHRLRTINRRKPAMHDGEMLYPPAMIYDNDDNFDFVHPFNSTYVRMGVRAYPDAHLLEPGEIIQYFDHKGDPQDLWVDQETVYQGIKFDIGRNLHEMLIRQTLIKESKGATVPSRALASYFRDVLGQKNVYVFPNTIVPEDFENFEVVRKDNKVRILWQGGDSHYVDWYPLREAVKRIVEKYRDKVTFVMWGSQFDWVNTIIPEDMIEKHGWTMYEAYKLRRGLLNIDINLCPLVDNPFNRCKSAIKWYEASIWEKPEVTLAQRTEPYHEIEENVTGLLFSSNDEFVEKLSALIESKQLRERLAHAAKEWVLANRTPDATIPGLFEFYEDTRARQKREYNGTQIKVASIEDLKKLDVSPR